jgi:hypothetical protein
LIFIHESLRGLVRLPTNVRIGELNVELTLGRGTRYMGTAWPLAREFDVEASSTGHDKISLNYIAGDT